MAAEADTPEKQVEVRDNWFKFNSLELAHLPHVLQDPNRRWEDLAHFVQYHEQDHDHEAFAAHAHNMTSDG